MNAIEFVKEYGVHTAKTIINSNPKVDVISIMDAGFCVGVNDLKQIVEAFEIIGLFKNLDHAKLELTACETAMHSQILVKLNVGVGYIDTCRVKQAIELVEKVNASD